MAMLSKGMSYRRQGSSGIIWADNMLVTEDGNFAIAKHSQKPEPSSKTSADPSSGISNMNRSRSVGSASSILTPPSSSTAATRHTAEPAPNPGQRRTSTSSATPVSHHKSSFRFFKWLKKALTGVKR